MARIAVAYEALEHGRFPAVCCKTGAGTDNYVRVRFVDTPTWTWVLLPVGFIPFVIARMLAATEFGGILPMAPAVCARLRRLRIVAAVAGVAGIATLLGGVAAWGWLVAGLALLAVAAACVIAGTIVTPDARRDLERGAVELRSVHRRFVETIEAAWAAQAHGSAQTT